MYLPPFWEVLFLNIFIKTIACGCTAKLCIKIQCRPMYRNHPIHMSWYHERFKFTEWYFNKFFFWMAFLLRYILLTDWQDEVFKHALSCSSWIIYDPRIVQIFSWEAITDLCAELINTCFISDWYCSLFWFWIYPTVFYYL